VVTVQQAMIFVHALLAAARETVPDPEVYRRLCARVNELVPHNGDVVEARRLLPRTGRWVVRGSRRGRPGHFLARQGPQTVEFDSPAGLLFLSRVQPPAPEGPGPAARARPRRGRNSRHRRAVEARSKPGRTWGWGRTGCGCGTWCQAPKPRGPLPGGRGCAKLGRSRSRSRTRARPPRGAVTTCAWWPGSAWRAAPWPRPPPGSD
jgi:hypothetical protein